MRISRGFNRSLRRDHFTLGIVTLSDDRIFKVWTKFNENDIAKNLKFFAAKWLETTKEFTEVSLVSFINNLLPGYAYTQEDFEKYRKKTKDELN